MAANTRVLLIGGNGKIARLLTPLMLKRSWKVLSLIRDSEQEPDIKALGVDYPEQLETLVHSLEEVKSEEQAQVILSSTRPNYIVWSAGAGGKGGPERTDAVDRLACTSFIGAAAASKSVTKFLLISYLGSRRNIAPWWTSEEWESTQKTNHGVLKTYYPAKLASDASLNIASKRRGEDFAGICLRPTSLVDRPAVGAVLLGRTRAGGEVARADVAEVAVELLSKSAKSCWLDLQAGEEPIAQAVDRCIRQKIDCAEGEPDEGLTG